MTGLVKKLTFLIVVGLCVSHSSHAQTDSLSIKDKVFVSKGDASSGVQFFYLDFDSSNSEWALILQHLDANGSIRSFSPYLDYAYKDNRSVGVRVKFLDVNGAVSNADFSMFGEDSDMSLQDVSVKSITFQTELYHRSYAAIDGAGRFGAFMDVALGWSHTDTSFNSDGGSSERSSISKKMRLAVHPGLMIFVTPRLSTHMSVGIGGAQYSTTDYVKGGEVVGHREASRLHFGLDLLDISYGLSLHF